MRRVCVFCGSATGAVPAYAAAARRFGECLTRRKLGLVYGGGNIGLMGVLADAVLAGGGEVIGVIPGMLREKELAHGALTELHVVGSMHARKALMAEKADAFVALPGGYGTADEFFEMLTWRQLRLHDKPIGLLNVAGFFDPFLVWVDLMVREGFVKHANRTSLRVSEEAESLLDLLFED
jgi:uncharacterized protein (TIGR00730 family)